MSEEKREGISLEKPQQSVYTENIPQPQGVYKESEPQLQGSYQTNTQYQQNTDYSQNTYQQNAYGQNPYQQMYQEPYQPVSQAFGIAALIMGIISLVLFCTCINLPLAVVAIIFGIIQLCKTGSSKGAAIIGIITSALSIVLFMVMIIGFMFSTDFQDALDEYNYGYDYNYQLPDGFGNDLFEDDNDTF